MEFERTRKRAVELNLIPLVDIVFHILVFVMLTMSFVVSESIELSLPAGKANPVTAEVTRIQIDPSGAMALNQQWVTADALRTYLTGRMTADPAAKIAIFTTSGVSVQQLVGVMDMVYLAGGRNVQVDRIR